MLFVEYEASISIREVKKKKKKGGRETARVYNNTLLCMNWVLLSRYQHPEKEENHQYTKHLSNQPAVTRHRVPVFH
jgi:hypothetical protein